MELDLFHVRRTARQEQVIPSLCFGAILIAELHVEDSVHIKVAFDFLPFDEGLELLEMFGFKIRYFLGCLNSVFSSDDANLVVWVRLQMAACVVGGRTWR